MIVDIFRDVIHWFLGLMESVTVLAAILLTGLVIGVTGFWVLSRVAGKLAGPPSELDSDEYELHEDAGEEIVSIQRDEDSPPSDFRV